MFGFLLNPSKYFIKNLMASLSISYVNGMCYLRTKSFHVRYSWQFMLLRMKWNTECIIPFDLVQQKKKQLHYYLRCEILLAVYASAYIRNVLFHSILFRLLKKFQEIQILMYLAYQFVYQLTVFVKFCKNFFGTCSKKKSLVIVKLFFWMNSCSSPCFEIL